jgi:hypothetical protein
MPVARTVYGVDFTSAPSARKPITCARAVFDGAALTLEALERLENFAAFERFLATPGPWTAGMDFPFGQSRRFVENIDWPTRWEDYVRGASRLDRPGFRQALEDYKRDRSPGDKQHLRACDRASRSQSPQTLYGTPVALMFFEGAPRLLAAGVHLPYHHDGDTSRVVVEAYPGIAARQLIGRRGYKSDDRRHQTPERQAAREDLFGQLTGESGRALYGFSVDAPARLALDPSADELDALICAVQAAWALARADEGYGGPSSIDRLEGWIADPALADAAGREPG